LCAPTRTECYKGDTKFYKLAGCARVLTCGNLCLKEKI
jgi:hypothetical protein